MMANPKMIRQFTGWHMTAILVGFFAIIITVNFTMARLALGSFGGTVVDNSYVASQYYNSWLAKAAEQEKLGWRADIALDGDRHVAVKIAKDGQILDHLKIVATALHPLGRVPPVELAFAPQPAGMLRSVAPLPYGRWKVEMSVRRNSDIAHYMVELK